MIAGAMIGQPPNSTSQPVPAPMVLVTPAASGSNGTRPAPKAIPRGTMTYVKAEVRKFIFHSPAEERIYNHAAALFPSFCQEWQRMLHDRETNNLEHITWTSSGGYETATYTGYGKVESCETKESVEGVPIGKVTYEEMVYYLVGKTVAEAQRAVPRLVRQTHTLEIFSWEKDKWFY
jgi:hypothetical protein